jgi:predicted ATPase
MAAAILEDTSAGPRATLRYFCSPYREDSPLHPCIQQLEHVAGFLRDDAPESKLAKLGQTLQGTSKQDF